MTGTQKLIIAFIMLALVASIILFSVYPTNSPLGERFGVDVIFLFARYLGLYAGILMLIIRLTKILKNRNNFIYILTGALNLCVAIIGLFLFMFGHMNAHLFNAFILNFIIVVLVFSDVFVFGK